MSKTLNISALISSAKSKALELSAIEGKSETLCEEYMGILRSICPDWYLIPSFNTELPVNQEKPKIDIAVNIVREHLNALEYNRIKAGKTPDAAEKHASALWNKVKAKYRESLAKPVVSTASDDSDGKRGGKRDKDQLFRDALAAWISVIGMNERAKKGEGITLAQSKGRDMARALMKAIGDHVPASPKK